MTGAPEPNLGSRLRSLREQRGKSLREIERVASINSGYLSQLERGAVAQPTPSMIQRLSEAYDVPLSELMSWAGYSMATHLTRKSKPSAPCWTSCGSGRASIQPDRSTSC